MLTDFNQLWINKKQYLTWEISQKIMSLTIRAADRQNAVPFALASAYSSYSASRKWRSAIAKSRGSCKSKAVSETAQPSLQDTCEEQKNQGLDLLMTKQRGGIRKATRSQIESVIQQRKE